MADEIDEEDTPSIRAFKATWRARRAHEDRIDRAVRELRAEEQAPEAAKSDTRLRTDAEPVMPRDVLSRADAAAYLNHSLRSFERHVQPELERLGLLIKIGGKLCIRREDLESWVEKQRRTPSIPNPEQASRGSTRRSQANVSGSRSASPTPIALTAEAQTMSDALQKRRRKRTPGS